MADAKDVLEFMKYKVGDKQIGRVCCFIFPLSDNRSLYDISIDGVTKSNGRGTNEEIREEIDRLKLENNIT